uniref:Nodule-specific cysteine-rich peptide L39 n=1 Tax=Lens culinaris TaxID=3864 RepID=A0A7T8DVA3_LENCU|nr:nodule-specific cysteine-rich peptide L39 [Lens culinaris]
MTTILKFVYAMILFISLLLVVNGAEIFNQKCKSHKDCPYCTPPKIRQCVWFKCYCF